jgi:thymidylate synthase ThyX
MDGDYHVESFTAGERVLLSPWVTDVDGPVFVLTGLPQVTCAALFARYSRSPKSLRRLLLDEFSDGLDAAAPAAVGTARASDLFGRVLADYGDDSVAQLAGVHLACEQASQLLCKAIEWGRLAGYLEQSTRYIPYTDRRDGHYRYHLDPEVEASDLAPLYHRAMDGLFDTYCAVLGPLREHLDRALPEEADAAARRRAVRALSLDLARALLPAGTVSNVGVFASPQALEQMVLRLRAHPLPEARAYAERIATELRRVIPDFIPRLDRLDRGGVWAEYLAETAEALRRRAAELVPSRVGPSEEGARLVRWDPDGELRVAAAALYPHAAAADEELLDAVRALPAERLGELIGTAAGQRRNRRHRPGRGFEHTEYTFEVVSDYGAFRDLQRHRMLTIQWQELTCELGSAVPDEVVAAGAGEPWAAAVRQAEEAWERLRPRFPQQSGYLATLGHRLRYQLRLNAREAMHLVELRSSPQAHPAYRRLALEMLSQIRDVAGHRHLAAAMRFAGSDDVHLPRYAAEAARGAPAAASER